MIRQHTICSQCFYIVGFCHITMEMVPLPEVEETLQSWKKKKYKKKKKNDEREESEENAPGANK